PVHPRCPLRPARRSPMSPARDSRTSPEPGTSPAQASEPADAALRVILVDDENLIRSALATMLSLEADLDVRGEAATVADGLRLAEAEQPDIAVLDLQLPDGDGRELAARIGEASPATRCLGLRSPAPPRDLKRALPQAGLGLLP